MAWLLHLHGIGLHLIQAQGAVQLTHVRRKFFVRGGWHGQIAALDSVLLQEQGMPAGSLTLEYQESKNKKNRGQ